MVSDSGRRVHPRRSLAGVDLLCYRIDEASVPQPRKNIGSDIVDISQGGARLRLVEPMAQGEAIALEIKDRRSGESFRARGEVRWCAPGESRGHTVGLQFSEIYTPVGRRERFTTGPWTKAADRPKSATVFEKRKDPRFAVEDYVVTCLPRGPLSTAGLKRNLAREVQDLSRKGVRLSVSEALKPGTCLLFALHMNRFADTLEATAEVRWCRSDQRQPASFVAGLHFLDLPEDKRKMIDFMAGWFAKKARRPDA